MIKRLAGWTLLVATCVAAPVFAADEAVPVNPDHPDTYTVQPGDTLWGISQRFLQNPWQWPEVWHVNEQVGNPHRIYPGDVLKLVWQDGRPSLVVTDGPGAPAATAQGVDASGVPVVKLRPAIRELPLSEAIPAIPLRAIKAFLNDSRIASEDELKRAPYIVAGEDRRIVMGKGDLVFGRDLIGRWQDPYPEYGVYRAAVTYRDPDTGEVLGLEAERVGSARVLDRDGEVATMRVVDSSGELRVQDKLMYDDQRTVQPVFTPRAAPEGSEGRIVHIFGTIGYGARNDVIVINRGLRDKVENGHVFAIMGLSEQVRDRSKGDVIVTPARQTGMAIVFRSFEKASYALITESERPVSKGDQVAVPHNAYR